MSGELRVLRDVPDAAPSDPYVVAGFDTRASSPGLSPRASRAARHLAEGLFATDAGPPPKERLDWLERDLGDFFGHVTLRARLLFLACVTAVSILAPLLILRRPGLGHLALDERVRAIHAFERTPLSMALLGAKAMLCIVYFEHPDAAAEIGWDQACMGPPR